ncbi:MAG: DUF4837 family protein [Bacteroidales bacterium]|nr:DUF4837 family protein [Bacteroidales bacterium]
MKRFLKYLALAAAAVMTIVSCSEEKRKKALLPNISGKAGEVIVVIDQGIWEGSVGTVLRDSLAADCPYLPQREPLYTLVNVAPSGFNNMFQIHRNIIIVNVSSSVTEPGILFKKDQWAAPQYVIYVNAADSDEAASIIKENSQKMITVLEQAERDRLMANTKKYEELKLSPVVTEMVGGSPRFPSGYQLKKKTDDFIWITYDTQFTQQSVLVFKYPVVEGEDMMSPESLIAENNKMLKNNVPGMFENTYMTIAPVITPSVKYMKYKGIDFAEIRGLWEVHNDYMGGPFVAHAFYSEDGKEIIVLEAFVFAPKYDKRQYLRQVESILYSFAWAEKDTEK